LFQLPQNEFEWLKIANDFRTKWNFPNCLGAMDGRHVEIIAPSHSGTTFDNYNQIFSIILLGVVDANYKFIYANVRIQGRISDGGVFKHTSLYEKLLIKSLNILQSVPLPDKTNETQFVFIADDAFASEQNVIKPFPDHYPRKSWQRIFNYRICRARRIFENVFEILCTVFRILRIMMPLSPQKATSVTLATIYVHNYLRNRKSARYTRLAYSTLRMQIVPGLWRAVNANGVPLQPLN
jgi:hypothetical protein